MIGGISPKHNPFQRIVVVLIADVVGGLVRHMGVTALGRVFFPARHKNAKQSKEKECLFHVVQIPNEMFNPCAVRTKSLS